MKLSVVIPTLHSPGLRETVAAVHRQTRSPDEVIVVGCEDPSVLREIASMTFVDTNVPVCAAAARNRGIQAATGDVIAFTDSDCIPRQDWLERHLEAHERGEVVVGGGIDPRSRNYWTRADNVAMFHEFLADSEAGYRRFLPTLNLSVRREAIERTGGMDETFPGAAAEDTDWTLRLRIAGCRLWFEPRAVVHHVPPRTTWRDVMRHWTKLGFSAIRVRHRYPSEFGTPALAGSAAVLRLCSPAIAAWSTLRLYSRKALWRSLDCLPVVYVSRILYCFGAARSVADGFAFE